MDLQKILSDIVEKYGKNEGFEVPEIMWSEENMLSRYGEYQFWLNRLLVSRLFNTDKVSEEAVASVVFHEYTHQLYRDHNEAFNKRMKLFKGYSKYRKELDEYLDSIQDFPTVMRHDLQMEENEEIVFCYLPFDSKDEDSYWNHFCYISHYLVGYLPNRITKEYCGKTLKQVVWLVNANGADYVAGWCKNAYIYTRKRVLDVSQFGIGKIDYKMRYPVASGKLLLPPCLQFALSDDERPEKLAKYGICSGKDMDSVVLHEICDVINSYAFDFTNVGLSDDAIDSIPGIEITDVDRLIEMARDEDNRGYRAVWILNKAVDLEKSYRTYFERAMAFTEICLFDRAIVDFEEALKYSGKENDDVHDEKWINDTVQILKGLEREMRA